MNSIGSVFNDFSHLNVLIIGDVMVDSYIWGDVGRISPEAPVPVIRIKNEEQRLGGAANVARNVLALGARPMLCSVIGGDDNGRKFVDIMNMRGLEADGIIRSDARITTVKERLLSGSQHLLRVDREFEEELTSSDQKKLIERADVLMKDADVVIFEDYDKGVLSPSVIKKIVQLACDRGIPTVVDPKKKNFMFYNQVTLFKPNLKEIMEGLKVEFDVNDNQALSNAVGLLKEKLNIEMALITRSELGVYMDTKTEKLFLPAHIRAISDVSGAGDTVVSTASLCLALGLAPHFIAGLSNLAGGLVCEHLGVVPINKEQLQQEALDKGLKVKRVR